MNNKHLYECANFFMARTALLPIDIRDPKTHDSLEDFLEQAQGLNELSEAILLASPNLYEALQKSSKSKDEIKKTFFGVLKYFLRMCSRATPFGLFSFVNFGNFSDKTALHFNLDEIKKSVRPDMELIHAIHEILHKDYELVKNLKVMSNPNRLCEGSTISLIRFNNKINKQDVLTIRSSLVTEEIFKIAKTPILYHELEEKLFHLFSQHPKEKVKQCLWEIFHSGFLLSELSFCIDESFSLENLLGKIKENITEKSDKDTQEIKSLLELFFETIEKYKKTPVGDGLPLIENLSALIKSLKHVEYPLQIDSYLKANEFQLHEQLKPLLEEVATIIFSLTHQKNNLKHLMDYHKNFIEKYGTNRLIPISDLISPIKGLDLPENPINTEKMDVPWFKDFLAKFNATHAKEINIEDYINKMELSSDIIEKSPLSLELFFEVLSTSEEIEKGNFTIAMNSIVGSTQAGSTFGRFLYLWGQSQKTQLSKLLEKEESLLPNTIFVEASFQPLKARTSNVCFFEKTRKYQLQFNYHHKNPQSLDLDDIFVGANENRLYIYSKSLKKELILKLSTAINPNLAPPHLKLLLDISDSRFNNYSPCILEPFLDEPFLPRVRYKNVIMSPARWKINEQMIGINKNEKPELIEKNLRKAFEKYSIPEDIFLTEFDNRLLVNWTQPSQFKLILDKFISKGEIILLECLSNPHEIIVKSQKGSHVTEFVVPLVRKDPNKFISKISFAPSVAPLSLIERKKMPGNSDWLYFKYYLPQDKEKEFISNYLANLTHSLLAEEFIKKWFFVRYKEDLSHVRFRLQGDPGVLLDNVLPMVSLWSNQLMKKEIITDYSIHGYDREIERYGGPEMIETAESVFFADSRLCANLMENIEKLKIPLPLEQVAALVICNILQHSYESTDDIAEFLSPVSQYSNLLSGSRTQLKELVNILSFLQKTSMEESKVLPWYAHLNHEIQIFSKAIKDFNYKLSDEKITLWNEKSHIVDSLIHMHCNRLMGVHLELEKKARVLAHYIVNKQKYSASKQTLCA